VIVLAEISLFATERAAISTVCAGGGAAGTRTGSATNSITVSITIFKFIVISSVLSPLNP
jgi:hypothetical protein